MSEQLALVFWPRAPFQRRSPSSRDGALAAEGALDSQLARALRAYRRAGGRGLTDRELSEQTGIPIYQCPARRKALIARGQVTAAAVGKRRNEATGVRVWVWRVTDGGAA